MVKNEVYKNMSINRKRLPRLKDLKHHHQTLGDEYLNQFLKCEALIGPIESLNYLEDFVKSANSLKSIGINQVIEYNPNIDSTILGFLNNAKNLMRDNILEYEEELRSIQRIMDSLNNKVNQ
jgi:hypothetical protein